MKEKLVSAIVILVAAVLAVYVLGRLLAADPSFDIRKRMPGMDGEAEKTAGKTSPSGSVVIGSHFETLSAGPTNPLPGTWPRFRGDNFDNLCAESVNLATNWLASGPPVLWSRSLGEGHAGPAVRHGRVYILDYDEKDNADSLLCLALDDGRLLWRRWYKVQVKNNHGRSRTVPAVTDKHVLTIGPMCHVMCVDPLSGDLKWGVDLVRDYNAKVPLWYTGQCPLMDGETAVLAVGGESLLIGLDGETGRVLWQTPNPGGWKMSHSSVMIMTICGKRMYVYSAIGGAAGVSAEPADLGTLLWTSVEWKHSVVAPSPVALDNDRILLTAGYGGGSMILQISQKDGVWRAETKATISKEVFACEQHTPIYYKGFAYSILPSDAGEHRKELVCLSPDGETIWTSGRANRFGIGPFLMAQGRMFLLDDDGTLSLAEVSKDGYVPLTRARILRGRDAWAPMALVGGRLLARDWRTLLCMDVSEEGKR